MAFTQRVSCELFDVAADLLHVAHLVEHEAVFAEHLEIHLGAAHIVDVEMLIEESNERAERCRGVVVLRLRQQ